MIRNTRLASRLAFVAVPMMSAAILVATSSAQAQTLPLRQSQLDEKAADPKYRIPLDSTSDMRWMGGGATIPRWSHDGEWFYFQFAEKPGPVVGTAGPDDPWWRVSKDGRKVESVSRADAARIPASISYTRDRSRAAWFARNELTFWKKGSAPKTLLARDVGLFPQWSPDERTIRWTENNALWEIDPDNGVMRQLTKAVVQTEPPKADKVKDALKREQADIFDFVKRQKAIRDSAAKLALVDAPWKPITTPYKSTDQLSGITLPANGKYVTYIVIPQTQPELTQYTDFVNETGIAVGKTSRPKVGAPLAMRRAAIVPADPSLHPDSVKVKWVDTAGFGKGAVPIQLSWNRQGTHLVAEFQSLDWKDRWIVLVDPATGKQLKTLDHAHDDAWFGGPSSVAGRFVPSFMSWLPDDETLALTSEVTGWAHLYLVDMNGTHTQLTKGDWEVRNVQQSADGTAWWISAGMEHPNELHVYRLPIRGGTMQRVDHMSDGELTPSFSPDESLIAGRFASPSRLPDLYLVPTSNPEAPTVQVTRSGTDAFWRTPWAKSDFVTFNDERGKPVYARVYRARTVHANKPAVLEIHGAGYAQGVHKAFGGASAHGGPLYAQYLADRGVTYMVLDYRGSAGYGRDMRTDVYRSMGKYDVGSALAAIPFLQRQYGVNPKHVGLFGCSYGGFFTLMALFQHPGVFEGGAAQCSVTDWAHYDHSYTTRILNGTSAEDSAAYRASSPIYYAAGLKDKLLLQHGLVDDNVEYQDAVRLVQRLMELGKDFDFVTYPIEAHGWQTRWSKIDSQRRLTKLWEETVLKR